MALGLGNAATAWQLRRVCSLRDVERLGLEGVVLDGTVLLALVWTFSFSPFDTTWVIGT